MKDSGAIFSPCMQYRYHLWRVWSDGAPAVFIMLNPSTADEIVNDPTVERCERRARMMGYGGLRVVNIFALRSTDPKLLFLHNDPIGEQNDKAIIESVSGAGLVVCGWGGHGKFMDRGNEVLSLIRNAGVIPYCLKINKDNTPKHPLYMGYDTLPKEWK